MKTVLSVLLVLVAMGAAAQDIGLPPALYQQQRGKGVTIGGCGRQVVTPYIIDDVAVMPAEGVPTGFEMTSVPNDDIPTSFRLSREEIRKMPYTEVKDIVAISSTVRQLQRGGAVNTRGGNDDVLYVVDGMVIMK